MLHNAADDRNLPIGNCVHIHLDGVFQKFIDEHGMIGGCGNGQQGKVFEFFRIINNFHGPAAQYIGWPDHDRIADIFSHRHGFSHRCRRAVFRLHQS